MERTNSKLAILESALESAYLAQDADLVFSLCHAIAEEISQQSYQDGVARMASNRAWEESRKASNSTSEDQAA